MSGKVVAIGNPTGEGVSKVYPVELKVPLWGWGGFIMVLLLIALYNYGKTDSFRSKMGPRNSIYDNMTGNRNVGPDSTTYNEASRKMLEEGVSEGGTDSPNDSTGSTDAFRGRREGMGGPISESALEKSIR